MNPLGLLLRAAILVLLLLGTAQAQSLVTEPAGLDQQTRPDQQAPDVSASTPQAADQPFGAGLFRGSPFPVTAGANPAYRLKAGDHVSIRLFGTTQADLVQQVDMQGNIFLPEIGPVRLAGIPAGQLTDYLNQQIATTYSSDVEVYATLLEAQNISVFVTGFVNRPGRYAGQSTDSIIDYLGRAGGIQYGSGSYRDIQVLRGNNKLTSADLYQFLLYGKLPKPEFVEGDTIVVGQQRAVVKVAGAVRNAAIFEFGGSGMSGSQLVELARPLPGVSYAMVVGTRSGVPFSAYVPMAEFGGYALHDQDEVTFNQDASADTITVSLEGRFLGPSTYVVARSVSLRQLLDYVEVDPTLSNLNGIHLRRKSVAEQQFRALQQALDRLQQSVLTAVIDTSGEAQIRGEEADLVLKFVDRARTYKPEGIVVLTDGVSPVPDIRLEDGDVVVIPERSSVVNISGEVLVPQTVLWEKSLTAQDYIKLAGGYTERGDESRVVVRHPNGSTVIDYSPEIQPGDDVVVLPEVEFKAWQFAQDVIDMLYKLTVITFLFVT